MKKKLLFLVAVFCFLGLGVQAQSTMSKGQLVGSLKVGFSDYGLPLGIAADYGVVSGFINGNAAVSVGGEVGVYISDAYTHLSLAARGNFHYEFVNNLDTYLGLNLGLVGRNFALNGHLGARYYFGKVGVGLEFGMGNHAAGGTIGVSMKF
ncbi:MAG: hypothetical protein IJE76_08955 [Bacteroidales bacterium]|nr:hypothetical protein [Bacteroidales bacterium]